jgi:hypothetical protein
VILQRKQETLESYFTVPPDIAIFGHAPVPILKYVWQLTRVPATGNIASRMEFEYPLSEWGSVVLIFCLFHPCVIC